MYIDHINIKAPAPLLERVGRVAGATPGEPPGADLDPAGRLA